MRTEVINVTPAIAAEWLERNTANRYLSPTTVREIANAILNDKFMLTHQGIAFGEDGTLIDGQHRLAAIVLAGRAVRMSVSWDVDPATFGVIDAGKKRSFADLLTIERGQRYAALTAAACRVVAIADRVDLADTTTWAGSMLIKLKLDRATLADLTLELSDGVASIIEQCKSHNIRFRLAAPFVAALYVIQRDTVRGAAEFPRFLASTVGGEGLTEGDVRLRLRDALMTERRSFDPRQPFYATVKAWNLHVDDLTVKWLRFAKRDLGIRPV